APDAARSPGHRTRRNRSHRPGYSRSLPRHRLCRDCPAGRLGRAAYPDFKQYPAAHWGACRVGDPLRTPALVLTAGAGPGFLRFIMLKSVLRGAVCATALLSAGVAFADVTVYTAGPAALIEKLAAGFTAESGIKVNVFQATTGKVMARIEAEASNPVVDVLISASWDTATDFTSRGWLLPYKSP